MSMIKELVVYKIKRLRTSLAVALALVIAVIIMHIVFPSNPDRENEPVYTWKPEKSYFVDYEIIDEDTVKFRYSICLENILNEPTNVAIGVTFDEKELNGWVTPDFFIGYDDVGEMLYATVDPKTVKNVVFTFFGEYLGGEVNEELSFPEITLMYSLEEKGEEPCSCGWKLKDHSYYDEEFVYDPEMAVLVRSFKEGEVNVGTIINEEYAKDAAYELWMQGLAKHDTIYEAIDFLNGCPIFAQFSKTDGVWYVHETANLNTDGVFPLAIIKPNGDVVAIGYY